MNREQKNGMKGMKKKTHPVAGLQKANKPEEEIDIEEEEGVGQKNGMVQTPRPQSRTGVIATPVVVIKEGEIEEYGRKRSHHSNHRILQIPHTG